MMRWLSARKKVSLLISKYAMVMMHLVCVIVMSAVEMLVQELHKASIPTPSADQLFEILDDVERIRPHVALCPPGVLAGPCSVCVASLHEESLVVEHGEWCVEGAGAESLCVGGFVQEGCED